MGPFRRDILEEHADEAAFLFRQRGRAFASRLYRAPRLGDLDERLRAHLDGLVVAGEEGWKAVAGGLTSDDPALVFVSAMAGLAAGGSDARKEVETALGAPSSVEGLLWALRLAGGENVESALREWTRHASPLGRALACGALIFRGEQPPAATVASLLAEDAPAVLAIALGVVLRQRGREHAPRVVGLLDHGEPSVRAAALAAGLALARPEAAAAGRRRCGSADPEAVHALEWAPLAAEEEMLEVLLAATAGEHGRLACLALGRLGYPAGASGLLSAAADDSTARAAGHALALLFGLDLRALGLELPPERRPASAEEMELDPDEDLPWPDLETLTPVVRAAADAAPGNVRLRGGRTWSAAVLEAEIVEGCLPDREQAMRERYLRDPRCAWREPRAWSTDQAAEAMRGEMTKSPARSRT